jgi:hypothetical protein
MKRMMIGVLFALLVVPAIGAENADSEAEDSGKYELFSQPGIERAQVLKDFDECRDLAGNVQPPPAGYVYAPGLAASAATGFIQGMMQGAQRRHMSGAAFRKCLNIKGYQRFAATREEAKSLYGAKWAVARERIADAALAPVSERKRLDP